MTWQTIVFCSNVAIMVVQWASKDNYTSAKWKRSAVKRKITFFLLFLPHYCSWVFVNDKETFSKFQTDKKFIEKLSSVLPINWYQTSTKHAHFLLHKRSTYIYKKNVVFWFWPWATDRAGNICCPPGWFWFTFLSFSFSFSHLLTRKKGKRSLKI